MYAFILALCLVVASAMAVYAWSGKQQFATKPSYALFRKRRQFVNQCSFLLIAAVTTMKPEVSRAGEVGARITQAVTTSDLGISVRRSVVRGAQVMDNLDLQAERLSDRLGLGSERTKRPGKPQRIVIPEPKSLDTEFAAQLLGMADQAFLDLTKVRAADLKNRINVVTESVGRSFERSGLALPEETKVANGPQFNFASYVHFKAYSDLIVERNIEFGKFKPKFEDRVGKEIVALLDIDGIQAEKASTTSYSEKQMMSLYAALEKIDFLAAALVNRGLVASIGLAKLDPDDVEDWSQTLSDLSWSVALDGDITQQSQILLQEQGFRFYPNFPRCAIQTILRHIKDQTITTEDYYMDTDYNSDPNEFDVKEVLINVSIENNR